MKMSDRAISERDEDVLERWGIAKAIFDLIANGAGDAPLRIGVYGGWGEGKTSVLRIVESLARKADIPVCWFSVWAAQSQPDLWGALFDALQSLAKQSDWSGRVKAFVSSAAKKTETVADLSPYTKAAHSLAKLAKLGPKDAERVLAGLSGRRAIVLVDDVDRVDAALMPKLLMGLHDLFDELGQCTFVVAVDPTVVTGGLTTLNPAWSSAPAFLEKIIQYPFWLPRPTREQVKRLVLEALQESRLAIPEGAFMDVLELLPLNPRKVKQFVRSLRRLQATLERYGEDEWNPTLVLILELLRTTCAEAAEELLQDVKFIEELVVGRVFRREQDLHHDGTTIQQRARIEAAVEKTMRLASPDDRARLVKDLSKISSAATESLSFSSADEAVRHVRLDQEPPVMTLREFDAIAQAWRHEESQAALRDLLAKHARTTERSDSAVLEASAIALLQRRAEMLGTVADSDDAAEVEQAMQHIEALSSLLDQLVRDFNVLGDSRVRARVNIFVAMRNQTAQAANRLDYEPYGALRQRLREQLLGASIYLRDRAADVLNELKPWERQRTAQNIAGAQELNDTRERLHGIFSEFLCDDVLKRFTRRGGIAGIGTFSSNPAEIWLLIEPKSAFYAPECRAKLLALAGRADEFVAQNFFFYLRLLLGEHGGVARSPVATDAAIVVPAWEAAIRIRPHPRLKADVVKLGSLLREALGDNNAITMPGWVESTPESVPDAADA